MIENPMPCGIPNCEYCDDEPDFTPPTLGSPATYGLKDSGKRQEFESGMVRDTDEDKINFLGVRFGPMYRRWAEHVTRGRKKYPDVSVGVPNWTLAEGKEELERGKASAGRHFEAWLNEETDEDHAAGVFFNINLVEYVRGRIDTPEPEEVQLLRQDLEYSNKRVSALSKQIEYLERQQGAQVPYRTDL